QMIKATGVHPSTFIIDTNPGPESVVFEIYPNTYLLHCVWHIGRNLEKQLFKKLVAEVWEVQSIENKPSVGQHRWYKDEMMNVSINDKLFVREKLQENSNSTLNISNISLFSTVAESWNIIFIELSEQTAAKVIGQKQSIKETLLGLACKCVELVDYNNPRDSDTLMKMFKE
ncbi:12298_t:CDS:2, partial [Dentiscutata erythropus]